MWPFYIMMITVATYGSLILWALKGMGEKLAELRTEHHEWWLIQADEQAAIAGKMAQIAADLKDEVTLNLERSEDLGDLTEMRKEVNELYRLQLTLTASLVESGRFPLQYIREVARPKVAMDVDQAHQRGHAWLESDEGRAWAIHTGLKAKKAETTSSDGD